MHWNLQCVIKAFFDFSVRQKLLSKVLGLPKSHMRCHLDVLKNWWYLWKAFVRFQSLKTIIVTAATCLLIFPQYQEILCTLHVNGWFLNTFLWMLTTPSSSLKPESLLILKPASAGLTEGICLLLHCAYCLTLWDSKDCAFLCPVGLLGSLSKSKPATISSHFLHMLTDESWSQRYPQKVEVWPEKNTKTKTQPCTPRC